MEEDRFRGASQEVEWGSGALHSGEWRQLQTGKTLTLFLDSCVHFHSKIILIIVLDAI